MSDPSIRLGEKIIMEGRSCYIIAEIGSNHNRNFETAKKLIDVAKENGCDVAKFQSYTADGIYSRYTPRISEMEGRSYPDETPYELIKRIEMPLEWHGPLKEYCDKVGITFCSTPFDESMVELLENVHVPFYKVASYELTYYPLLAKIAQTGKPVILSTGNSEMDDIELAVKTLQENGCLDFALLHCVSQYPAAHDEIHLRCIQTLKNKFNCVVGFSDHTMDSLSSALAVSLGALIIEKHITLDKTQFGPDHPFSLEPEELKQFVKTLRKAELILGTGEKKVRSGEEENHKMGRRSLVAANDIQKGEEITRDKLVIKRPALGLHPKYLNSIIGKRAVKDIHKDCWITQDSIMEFEYRDSG
mgnify:CR=1 FL=1